MFPSVQTHHQMVPNPPHLDHLASFQAHLNPDYFSFQQPRSLRRVNPYHHLDPAPPGFAIQSSRPSAPAPHRITTSFIQANAQDSGEYSLRRKTPSGTIDNGYDGSPAHLASGPPPFKHMILPASSKIFPSPGIPGASHVSDALRQRPIAIGGWPYSASAATTPRDQLEDSLRSAPASFSGWNLGQPAGGQANMAVDQLSFLQAMPQQHYHPASSLQCILGPGYQQVASPTIFSPAAFQHSQGWRDGGLPDFRSAIPMTPGYMPANAAVDSAFMPAQPSIHPALANGPLQGHMQPFRMHMSNHPPDDGFARYGHSQTIVHSAHRGLESLSLGSGVADLGHNGMVQASSQPHFKERALAQAHKTYADLLTYISQSKKVQIKSGSGPQSATKMVVYPRPPKQPVSTLEQAKPRLSHSATAPVTSYAQYLAQKQANAVLVPRPLLHRSHYSSGSHVPHLQSFSSPLLDARTSLDMLTGLCENSDWKWIDGMLLGGCLHYGLERYEDALEWFRRIITLDPSHVEAISNIAATLYCLNRHEEAEHHWWQAVKLRPSYLEAVEHLIGLLCSSQRNQEAVQAIEFIQRALRIRIQASLSEQPNQDTASETSSVTTGRETTPDSFALDADKDSPELTFSAVDKPAHPGFGSSGYKIPGSENGRMLLLIHAKGNILYGLKDIDGASQSFEEAVLISTGREVRGVRSLINRIKSELAPRENQDLPSRNSKGALSAPLLLSPEKAKHTAQLVFRSSAGQLPGLQFMPESTHKKQVISTTSNSLLSLAKIFQDAMSNGAASPGLMRQPAGVGDILALYYLSLSIQESPSTANNVGILLASVQQGSSQHVTPAEVALCQNVPGIVPGSGLALALAYYHYGLTLDSKHVHLHTNLGSLLKDIGQLDSAIQMYEKAVQCDGTFDIALTNLANAVKDRGRISDAIIYYKRAVQSNPDFAEAVCGLSTALNSVCDWNDRGGVIIQGGRFDRWHVDEKGMLRDSRQSGQANGLMKRVVDIVARQLKEASSWGVDTLQGVAGKQLIAQLRDARSSVTDGSVDLESELQRWAGKPWEGSRIIRLIERSTRATMRRWYHDKYIKGVRSATGYSRPKPPASLSVPAAPTVLPFHTFTCPLTAKDIRMISQRNALRISCSTLRSPWIPATVYEPPKPPSPHLNVGYVSSDFNNHPLAHLMQSVFGFHDTKRVKAFCYATTASDDSVHRQQIEREAPVFRDVSKWGSDRLVEQIVADGIHILVNLNGYTRGARNEVFAARPAPIQMSFMGFAGTLGAEWCDYLLADTTAVPPSTLRPHRNNLKLEDVFRDEIDAEAEDWVYSENIIYCKDTFFCCDHAQSADGSDERDMTWEEEQRRRWKMRKELFPKLSDDAIILGNFNQLYKIDPTTFRTWLRILAAVPNAVLWLLRFPELGETNLRRTAKAWAGEEVASRIVFTDVAQKKQHISRARVCDLFLDTPECNAHTTAADVLWSSTPLLTLPRYEYKMCSRMAASILKGALPKGREGDQAARDLIADDEARYEDFAIRLATSLRYSTVRGYGEGSGRLAELRKILWKSKWTCALFDTRRWVRDLEGAYEEAWRRWVAGEGGDMYL
ncbi:glycosyltransferase family 41 protein [Coniochaeta ligniaria NRRL 30616]|uniref:protein O-GlcNAc transferase n=1 Tax=Coniochaeta ligniaria NRRL 30616 TaxID=1408157 RepID=A0A1J7JIN3_9PEZI|nr:glycosyltransferase family 41 protein [Coniochaeta ligniaria NRRL 30616]